MLRTYARASKRKQTSLETEGTPSIFGSSLTTGGGTEAAEERDLKRRKLSVDFDETPPRPSTPPKELQFQPDGEIPSPGTPKPRLAKRMLSRSRTESSLNSITASPSRSLKNIKSLSVASLPSSPQRPETVAAAPLPVPVSVPTAAVKRTYAGTSRTFLVALPRADSQFEPDPLTLAIEEENDDESYSALRAKWGVDNSEDDRYAYEEPPAPPPSTRNSPTKKLSRSKGSVDSSSGSQQSGPVLPPGMMNDVRSITELRSRGESRRFLDEVGYLLEGLDSDVSIGLRRASALDLLTKLCDPDFARKAKSADVFGRTWNLLIVGIDGDRILSTILLAFAALVSQDQHALVEFAQSRATSASAASDFPSTILSLLPPPSPLTTANSVATTDILVLIDSLNNAQNEASKRVHEAALKRAGVARGDRIILTSLHKLISKKIIPSQNQRITLTLLATHTLSRLPPVFLRPSLHLKPLLGFLKAATEPICERLECWKSGARLFASTNITNPYSKPNSKGKEKEIVRSHSNSVKAAADSELPAFEHIMNCLTTLDSYVLNQWAALAEGEEEIGLEMDEQLIKRLVALCVVCEVVLRGEYETLQSIAHKTTELALRVLVGLTLDSDGAQWGQAFVNEKEYGAFGWMMRGILLVQDEAEPLKKSPTKKEDDDADTDVEDSEEENMQPLDRMYLALGLLTNLVQVENQTADMVHDMVLSPTCQLKRACFPLCVCATGVSTLELLAELYSKVKTSIKHELDDAGSASREFLAGHLAILLGLLMRGSEANRRVLLSLLTLEELLARTKDFLDVYARVGKIAENLNLGSTVVESGVKSKGEDIAREIVQFLEGLKNV